jgi:glutamate-5-semialdehyde dehydrogenase
MKHLEDLVLSIAQCAKEASYELAVQSSAAKDHALEAMACALEKNRALILSENAFDIKVAREKNLTTALIDRITLDDSRLDQIIASVRLVASLGDPVGKLITAKILANNIELKKIRVPLGVIGIIFEARPNVIVEVASLCLKSGNAVIVRGGSECDASNRILFNILKESLEQINFTKNSINIIPVQDRDAVSYLCRATNFVDLIIPRGGESLINAVLSFATVPVIKHYKGLCTIYVDEHADISKSLAICHNAKCQRPSVCNAVETILVHEAIAPIFIPKLEALFNEAKVQIRGCEKSCALAPSAHRASAADYDTEFLDLIIAVKVIPSLGDAIRHINTHGSHHSDAIMSEDRKNSQRFVMEIDSAVVYVNASTRFTDGGQFGLGAEMGISTDKVHARGPMGLNELTTYKWVALGSGQIRK